MDLKERSTADLLGKHTIVPPLLTGKPAHIPSIMLMISVTLFATVGSVAADESSPSASPRIVSTTPAIGASNVDPAVSEIVVVFDQEMAGGFSWTGGGEVYPEVASKPYWKDDKKTCVLPVKLVEGKFYRVGINSTSHKNFRGANGMAAPPRALYFTTRGADEEELAKLNPPKVESLIPENGAETVSPNLTTLTVTFTTPMGGGFSWTDPKDMYPETTDKPEWSEDMKTCVLPVKLEPDMEYVISLNSDYHINFSSAPGVPLAPVVWRFKTAE